MLHPDYKIIGTSEPAIPETTLTAIYPLVQGLHQNVVRKAVRMALKQINNNPQNLKESLSDSILNAFALPTFMTAINRLHQPQPGTQTDTLTHNSPARKRLALRELLAHHLSVKIAKFKASRWQAPKLTTNSPDTADFLKTLPFQLTAAQSRAIEEIYC